VVRVLVVDPNSIQREGVKLVFSRTHDIQPVGEAGNLSEALQLIRRSGWEVLLFDIATPGSSTGLEFLRERKACRECSGAVLVFTMFPENPYAVYSLKAGAAGYLSKQATAEELVSAVRRVSRGEMAVSSDTARLMVQRLSHNREFLHESLSEREFEVLVNLGAGRTPAQIAELLAISPKTISTYRARILEKLGMKATSELVYYALQHGLVPGLKARAAGAGGEWHQVDGAPGFTTAHPIT